MPKEFDDLVKKIKPGLRKAHPDWDEKRVDSVAYATAVVQWRKKYGRLP